jgi:pimeloyl-ACP methyl ester carboxylesterase
VTATDGADHHAVSGDGTEIGYWTSGEGPPLLPVHGVLSDHSRWEALRPHLAPSFTVHAMDRRGRGASGDAPEYAVEREFEDVAAVVDAVAAAADAPVAVYGHSGGASFALGAAALSSNVGRLVLYEPAVNTFDVLPPGLLERFDTLLAAGEPEAVVETFCRQILHMADEQVDAYRQQPSWPARVAAAHTLPRELRIPPERLFDAENAATVTVPTLLLEGSESPDGFKAGIGDVAAALPDARVAVLDGQGHTADVLAPELVTERLLAFLGEPHQLSDERIHRAVSADGTEIVGRVHGQGPPLVFLHGRLEDGDSCWGPMLPLLTDRFTCYTPSTRGRGLSGDNPDHAPERLVEDAVAFIDSIGEPVRVFGWSSGAALALAALARSTMGSAAAIYEPSVSEVIHEQDGARLRSAVAGMAEMARDGRPAEAASAFWPWSPRSRAGRRRGNRLRRRVGTLRPRRPAGVPADTPEPLRDAQADRPRAARTDLGAGAGLARIPDTTAVPHRRRGPRGQLCLRRPSARDPQATAIDVGGRARLVYPNCRTYQIDHQT